MIMYGHNKMTSDNSFPAFMKMGLAWFVWAIGAVNIVAILTVISTLLVITYTSLQIYKLWRDIQKDKRIENLAQRMANSSTVPTPLGKN